ncbi:MULTISPECIES: DUF5908 family protein [unclassified Xenorhabdus]|uniref:DUF5908 family protein n=1 Tax=unclassified Xenorhabdus TaxID=2632833 RepID=UPI000C064E57|nr:MULTISPECIES: DUF5908 family protein [unclassified Xenorhabdus]PHM59035.1 hypothetical protein Xekk_00875 [Xenorhabdus sp. KK7.4]
MTVEIRELIIQAKVVSSMPPTGSEQQSYSLVQESLDEAALVEKIKREVLAALRDEERWRS